MNLHLSTVVGLFHKFHGEKLMLIGVIVFLVKCKKSIQLILAADFCSFFYCFSFYFFSSDSRTVMAIMGKFVSSVIILNLVVVLL